MGDLDVPASVEQAMHGVSCVVLVTAPVVHQELNVIDSAVRTGVQHVLKITSKASADSPIARRRNQAHIESALIASGLEYMFLRNNAYMQNFRMMAPLIKKTNGFSNATGDGRIDHIDARDVAAVAVEIAASPAEHVARSTSFEAQKQAMIDVGLPGWVAEDNARAVTMMADGDCDYVTEGVASILGRPARSFEQFATDFAAAFS